jgi:hypothetical protein
MRTKKANELVVKEQYRQLRRVLNKAEKADRHRDLEAAIAALPAKELRAILRVLVREILAALERSSGAGEE